MLAENNEDRHLQSPIEQKQAKQCAKYRLVLSMIELAEAASTLEAHAPCSIDLEPKLRITLFIPETFLVREREQSRLEAFREALNKSFSDLAAVNYRVSPHPGLAKVNISLRNSFYEEFADKPTDSWVKAKQALGEFGINIAASMYKVDREELLSVFHESELSFAGLLALENPSKVGSGGIKVIFRSLKKYFVRLRTWKTLMCSEPQLEIRRRTDSLNSISNNQSLCMDFEEERDDYMATADNTLRVGDKESPTSQQLMDSKDWLAYIPCDSMPILMEENQSSCETSRSIASNCGSFYPERTTKISSFALQTKPSKMSKHATKQLLKTTEQELEAALEDTIDSDDEQAELQDALEYIQWFFSKILEELRNSDDFKKQSHGFTVLRKLEEWLKQSNQKLLDILSLRLMGQDYSLILSQKPLKGIDEPPEVIKLSAEDLLSRYVSAVLTASTCLGFLSPASAFSINMRVAGDYSAKVSFASTLADFCEQRQLHVFLEKLSEFSGDH